MGSVICPRNTLIAGPVGVEVDVTVGVGVTVGVEVGTIKVFVAVGVSGPDVGSVVAVTGGEMSVAVGVEVDPGAAVFVAVAVGGTGVTVAVAVGASVGVSVDVLVGVCVGGNGVAVEGAAFEQATPPSIKQSSKFMVVRWIRVSSTPSISKPQLQERVPDAKTHALLGA